MRKFLQEVGPKLLPKFLVNEQNKYDDLLIKISFIKSNPESLESRLMLSNFPIAFGLSGDEKDLRYETIYEATGNDSDCIIERATSDIPGEFLFRTPRIPLSRVPVIATTTEHQDELRALLDQYGYKDIKVSKLEALIT
jgi:hypothetical protein